MELRIQPSFNPLQSSSEENFDQNLSDVEKRIFVFALGLFAAFSVLIFFSAYRYKAGWDEFLKIKKLAKDSGYHSFGKYSIENLVIYTQAKSAGSDKVSPVMIGAIESNDCRKVLAVISALLHNYDQTQNSYDLRNVKKALSCLPQGQLEATLMFRVDSFSHNTKQMQLFYLNNMPLDQLIKYRNVLALSENLTLKIQKWIELRENLTIETAGMPPLAWS